MKKSAVSARNVLCREKITGRKSLTRSRVLRTESVPSRNGLIFFFYNFAPSFSIENVLGKCYVVEKKQK